MTLLPSPRVATDPTFPDPLVMQDGTLVTAAADWYARRSPELRYLFQTHMYGADPAIRCAPTGALLHETDATGVQEWAVALADEAPPVHVLLALPTGKPKGLFVGLNFSGNHTLTIDRGVRVSDALTVTSYANAPRGTWADTAWPLESIRARGYAVATAHCGEVIPDDPRATGGLSAMLRPKGSDTGAVIAWAWSLRQIAAWAGTRPGLVGVPRVAVGHSRLGKAALVAMAFDTDNVFAAAVPSQAGTCGPSPDRTINPEAETVKWITTAFPHWFAPKLTEYSDDPSMLPFDQHALIALCAPRPVFLANAQLDQWADPPGQLAMLRLAEPVYRLLAVDGLDEQQLETGRLGYWVRPGTHAMTSHDWTAYLTWADRWVK